MVIVIIIDRNLCVDVCVILFFLNKENKEAEYLFIGEGGRI